MALVMPFNGRAPRIAGTAFLAPTAVVIGDVEIGEDASIWFGAVLRGGLFLTILLGIAVSDARTYIIPDQFSLGGAAIGLALAPLAGGPDLTGALLGSALGFGFLWATAAVGKLVLGKDAMGGGDVKMMAMVGAFVGPAGVLLTLFGGSLLGALVFAPTSLRTGKLVPFGIFLALGAGIAYTWGDAIVAWYASAVL
jgi:leader peptidase (prepilin peptidase)/N-methyltransferase